MRAVKEAMVVPVLLLSLAAGNVWGQPVEEAMVPDASAPMVDAGCYPGAGGPDPWYLAVDAIFLDRSTGTGQVIVTGTNGVPALTGNDIDLKTETGPRFTLRRSFGPVAAEAVYFALYNQQAKFSTSPIGIAFGSPIIGLAFGETYTSELNNAEFNLRYYLRDSLSVLAGFRYMSLDESLRGNFFTPVLGYTNTDHRTSNDMYGGQVGVNWRCIQGPQGNTALDLGSKVGLFGNSQQMNAIVNGPLGSFATGATASELSFVAELGLVGSLRIWDCLWVRGGYQVMWLDGIALAPPQLSTAQFVLPGSRVNNDACVFYHGPIAGAEVRW
ncbi:MAG: hypothetical protein AB7K24_07695 [Gemmataceae bacterium]